MKYPVSTFLLAAFVLPVSKTRICQTSDAIIVEGWPTELFESSSYHSKSQFFNTAGQILSPEIITYTDPSLLPDENISSCDEGSFKNPIDDDRSILRSIADSGTTFDSLVELVPIVRLDSITVRPKPEFPWWLFLSLNPTNATNPNTKMATVKTKKSCGAGPYKTPSLDEQKRIVGGTDTVKNSWPSMVALLNNGRQYCGGSLIDSRHIITAAHCVAHMSSWDISRLTVALGMHSLQPTKDPELVKKVRRVTRHKNFNSRTFHNDVAVLTLDSPVEFTNTISPACLPMDSKNKFTGRNVIVLGWGALKEGGPQSNALQQVTVKVITNQECNSKYGKGAPDGIPDHMLCAAYPGRDACSGDSGGPMFVQNAPGSPWVQIGIVSWGLGGGPNYPGVYVRVTSFMNWIAKYLNKRI